MDSFPAQTIYVTTYNWVRVCDVYNGIFELSEITFALLPKADPEQGELASQTLANMHKENIKDELHVCATASRKTRASQGAKANINASSRSHLPKPTFHTNIHV